MALNDYDNKRQYTKYKRHVNESSERVDATTVNQLQDDLSIQQQETNTVKDTAFEERVYTIFNNNLYANAMFIDYYKTGEYLNKDESNNIAINYNKRQLALVDGAASGTATSIKIHSVHGQGIQLNDFFLITNENIPVGAEIKYYLETQSGERWPIAANSLKLPLHLSKNLQYGFKLIIELRANSLGESPTVNGYAILYWDAQVEKNYGMTNPDLMRFPVVSIGEDDGLTILIRDRAQEDKVVRVIEPLDEVTLTYNPNNEGRLAKVETYWPNYEGYEVTQNHELGYGEYTNSDDETDNVLLQVNQTTVIGPKPEVFDQTIITTCKESES